MKDKIQKSLLALAVGLSTFAGLFVSQDQVEKEIDASTGSTRANFSYVVDNHYSSRYNSSHYDSSGREKSYRGRIFNVKVNGQEVYCIEPFAALQNVGTSSGTYTTLADALMDTEHARGNRAKATRIQQEISDFRYFQLNPTSAIKNVMSNHSISTTDTKVALQYFIWEALGLTMADNRTSVYNPNETGLGSTVVRGEDYVWVPGQPGHTSHTFTAQIVRVVGGAKSDAVITAKTDTSNPSRVSINGALKVPVGPGLDPELLTGYETANVYDIPNGSYSSEMRMDVQTNGTTQGTIIYKLMRNTTTSPGTDGYWHVVNTSYVKEVFYVPAWYRAYRDAIKSEMNRQNNLTTPTFDERSKTVVVGDVATFTKRTGSDLGPFLRDSWVPTSRPSKPNYPEKNAHTYVWRSGNRLMVEPTMQSPDDEYAIKVSTTQNRNPDTDQERAYAFNGNVQNLAPVSGVKSGKVLRVSVKALKTGDIELEKRNIDSNAVVKDAKFELYLDAAGKNKVTDGNGKSLFTTGANGKVKMERLRVDLSGQRTYYVKEVSVPSPLVLDDKLYPVTVKAGETVNYDAKNKEQRAKITIQKTDKTTGQVLKNTMFNGAQFRVTLEEPYTAIGVKGKTHTVTIKDGVGSVSNLPLGKYSIAEIKAPEGYVLSDEVIDLSASYSNMKVELNEENTDYADNRQYGQITITKKDVETGLTLKDSMFDGAQFKVTLEESYNPLVKPGYSETVTIKNGAGKTSDKLDLGKYSIKEIKAPFGYTLSDKVLEIDNKYTNQNVSVNYHSTDYLNKRQLGTIEFHKRDVETSNIAQGDATLGGAKYELRLVNYKLPNEYIPNAHKTGEVVRTFTTDKNGYAKMENLELGTYEIVEVEPSEGYLLNPEPIRVELLYHGQDKDISTNVKQYSYNYSKIMKERNDLQSLVNGMITNPTQEIDRVPTYILKDSDIKRNEITTGHERVIMGRIEIVKSLKGHQHLPESQPWAPEVGAEFDIIHKRSGKVMDTIVTNHAGFGTSKYLPYGVYTIKQTKGAEGHALVKPYDVNINKDGVVLRDNHIPNEQIATRLKIVKRDVETGKVIPIEGVTFQIFKDKEGGEPIKMTQYYPSNQVLDTWATNEKGEVHLPELLPYGTYYIQEIEAPEGYYLDPNGERLKVNLKGDYTVIEALIQEEDVHNVPQKGQVILSKTGPILRGWEEEAQGDYTVNVPLLTDGLLGGAKFELRAAEDIVGKEGTVHYEKGELVEDIITKNGEEYVSIEVPLGKYTLQEIEAPEGYLRDPKVYNFEFTPQHQSVRVDVQTESVYNEKQLVEFGFTKEFEESEWFGYEENAWEDVIFGLFTTNDLTVNGITLPKDSLVGLTALTKEGEGEDVLYSGKIGATFAGDYYIKELETNEAYVLDETQHDVIFEYKPDGKLVEQEVIITPIENDIIRGDVELYKYDYESYETGLGGAVFELVAHGKDGEITIGKHTSDENGMISVEGLEYGEYYFREIAAPLGYVFDGEKQPFTISKDKQIIKLEKLNKPTIIQINKVHYESGEFVEGAELAVYDKDGVLVDTWISGPEPHIIKRLLVGETYTLKELQAPAGFATADPVQFTVENTEEPQLVEMVDRLTETLISKKSITGDDELPGAELAVYDSNGQLVEEWISGEEPHLIKGLLVGEIYRLVENLAPIGYATSSDVFFQVKDTEEIQPVEMIDDVLKVLISKEHITTGKELPGAHLQIIVKETGEIYDEWISTDKPHYIEMIPQGEYILKETIAPEGFIVSEEIEFEIVDTILVQEVVMKDDYTKVEISKKDLTNKEELPGAHLEIISVATGEVVESWISTDKPHYIEELPVGDYILKETTAPDGYVTSEEVFFTVEATGEVQTVEMFDDVTKLSISKKDITNGEELPGATLQILTLDGDVLYEWVSTEEPHYIEMIPQGEYILRETIAPDGYVTATDIRFTVEDTGEIQTVEMIDEVTTIQINKVDGETSEALKGAHLQLLDQDGNVLYDWISDGTPFEITKLPVGKYILREVEAPEGYQKAADMEIVVEDTGRVQHYELENVKIPEQPETPPMGDLIEHQSMVGLLGLTGLMVAIVLFKKREQKIQ